LWQAQTKQPITELRAANRRAPVGCRRALAVWLSGPAFTLYLPLLARQWGVSVRALEKAKAWIAAGELHRPVRKHRRRDAGGGVS
jgi:hypothetical protein